MEPKSSDLPRTVSSSRTAASFVLTLSCSQPGTSAALVLRSQRAPSHDHHRLSDARSHIRDIVGEEEGKKLTPIWGLNEEGEIRTAWREIGLPNAWYMMGNLAWSRFYSKHLALRTSFGPSLHDTNNDVIYTEIKAKQEGIFPGR